MSKSPAFQFYPNEWLSSPKIVLMTPAQEGAYIRLLAYAWMADDCGLPDDDEQLAALSRLNEGWLKGGSTVLRKCFEARNGRLFNVRLLEEKVKQDEWREKSAAGGKKSGITRKNKAIAMMNGGSRVVEPKGNSSVFSLQSSNNIPAKPGKETWLTAYGDIWTEAYGGEMPYKEAARAFKKAETAHGRERVLEGWTHYCTKTEAQYAKPQNFASKAGAWIKKCDDADPDAQFRGRLIP